MCNEILKPVDLNSLINRPDIKSHFKNEHWPGRLMRREARINFTTVSVFVHADLSNFKQSTNQQKQIFNKSMKNKTQQPV